MRTVDGGLYRTVCGAVVLRTGAWLRVLELAGGVSSTTTENEGTIQVGHEWYANGNRLRFADHPMHAVERIKP